MRILSCSLTLSDLKRGSQLKTRDSSNDPQAATYILATSRTNKGVKRHDRCNSKKYAQYVHRIQKGSVALTTVTKVPHPTFTRDRAIRHQRVARLRAQTCVATRASRPARPFPAPSLIHPDAATARLSHVRR